MPDERERREASSNRVLFTDFLLQTVFAQKLFAFVLSAIFSHTHLWSYVRRLSPLIAGVFEHVLHTPPCFWTPEARQFCSCFLIGFICLLWKWWKQHERRISVLQCDDNCCFVASSCRGVKFCIWKLQLSLLLYAHSIFFFFFGGTNQLQQGRLSTSCFHWVQHVQCTWLLRYVDFSGVSFWTVLK